MDKRIRVDEFEGASQVDCGGYVFREHSCRLNAQHRPQALTSGKDTVAHGAMNRGRARVFGRQNSLESFLDKQPIGFEEIGERHAWGAAKRSSGRNCVLGAFLFGLERGRGNLSVGLLQQNLNFAFGFFQSLLALARELYTFLKEGHRFVEGKIGALEALNNFFETSQRLLKFTFALRLDGFIGH